MRAPEASTPLRRAVISVSAFGLLTLSYATACGPIKSGVRPGRFDDQVRAISTLEELQVSRCRSDAERSADQANRDAAAERVSRITGDALPGALGDAVLFERMAQVYGQILKRQPGSARNVSAGDAEEFVEHLGAALRATSQLSDAAGAEVWGVFKKYYQAYIQGDFRDRTGTQLSRPEVKKEVGNETLSAALIVLLEAASDVVLRTPVLFTAEQGTAIYFPYETEDAPTVAAVFPELVQSVVANDRQCGVTEIEAKAVGYVSSLAGDESSIVSGMVLESFGDVELAFGVGGHFSVGDNETLATLVKTFFEVVSRRGTEKLFYDFFEEYTISIPADQRMDLDFRATFPDQTRVDALLDGL